MESQPVARSPKNPAVPARSQTAEAAPRTRPDACWTDAFTEAGDRAVEVLNAASGSRESHDRAMHRISSDRPAAQRMHAVRYFSSGVGRQFHGARQAATRQPAL